MPNQHLYVQIQQNNSRIKCKICSKLTKEAPDNEMISVNSRLKATSIIFQRKAFYRHRIPESSCVRKGTVNLDSHATSRNGDRKIMQSIRITSRPPSSKRK